MSEAILSLVTQCWDLIKECISTMKDEPILLMPTIIGLVGAIIGLTRRFLRFGRGRK